MKAKLLLEETLKVMRDPSIKQLFGDIIALDGTSYSCCAQGCFYVAANRIRPGFIYTKEGSDEIWTDHENVIFDILLRNCEDGTPLHKMLVKANDEQRLSLPEIADLMEKNFKLI